MASLIPGQSIKGCVPRRIEFDPVDGGRRQRVRLGNATMREGEDVRRHIEEVIHDFRLGQSHAASLCEWLNRLPSKMQERLEKLGLLRSSRQSAQSLGHFLDGFIEKSWVKDGTLTVYGHTIRNLIEHFGRGRMLQTIEPMHAEEFKEFLQEPAVHTACGHCPGQRSVGALRCPSNSSQRPKRKS